MRRAIVPVVPSSWLTRSMLSPGWAVVEQDRHVVGALVRNREVELRVAVEVADRDRAGAGADGERAAGGGREARARAPEQDRDVARAEVRDREVGVGVAVEVADRYREGGEARCKGASGGRREAPARAPEQDR